MSRLIVALLSWMIMSSAVSKDAVSMLSIGVVPFKTSSSTEDITSVIHADLQYSGKFKVIESAGMPEYPEIGRAVEFVKWQKKNVEYLVLGRLNELDEHRVEVEFELLSIPKSVLSGGENDNVRDQAVLLKAHLPAVPKSYLRNTGHYIAETVYETLTGEQRSFSTRICFVRYNEAKKMPYQIIIADYDGYNEQLLSEHGVPVTNLSQSPNRNYLAYVTVEDGHNILNIRQIYSYTLQRIILPDEVQGALAWSPDGKYLAFTLLKDESLDLYTVELATKNLKRLTLNERVTETPIIWEPDGQSIAFISEKNGKKLTCQIGLNGTSPQLCENITVKDKISEKVAHIEVVEQNLIEHSMLEFQSVVRSKIYQQWAIPDDHLSGEPCSFTIGLGAVGNVISISNFEGNPVICSSAADAVFKASPFSLLQYSVELQAMLRHFNLYFIAEDK